MGFETKISVRHGRRVDFESMISGVGSLNLDQKMLFARRKAMTGSLSSDWKAVGRDLAKSMASVKNEKNAA